MSEDQNRNRSYSKSDNLELRIVLIGEVDVGKK